MFGSDWQHIGAWYIISLVLAIWALLNIVQNKKDGNLAKAIWIVVVLFIPFFGFAAWLLFGPKAEKK